VFIDNQYGLID